MSRLRTSPVAFVPPPTRQDRPIDLGEMMVDAFAGLAEVIRDGHDEIASVFRRILAASWYSVEVPNTPMEAAAIEAFRRCAGAVELGRADLAVAPVAELRDMGVTVMVREPRQPAGPLGHFCSPYVRSPQVGPQDSGCSPRRGGTTRGGAEQVRIKRSPTTEPKRRTGPERFAPTPDPFVTRPGSFPNTTPGRNWTHTPSAPGE